MNGKVVAEHILAKTSHLESLTSKKLYLLSTNMVMMQVAKLEISTPLSTSSMVAMTSQLCHLTRGNKLAWGQL